MGRIYNLPCFSLVLYNLPHITLSFIICHTLLYFLTILPYFSFYRHIDFFLLWNTLQIQYTYRAEPDQVGMSHSISQRLFRCQRRRGGETGKKQRSWAGTSAAATSAGSRWCSHDRRPGRAAKIWVNHSLPDSPSLPSFCPISFGEDTFVTMRGYSDWSMTHYINIWRISMRAYLFMDLLLSLSQSGCSLSPYACVVCGLWSHFVYMNGCCTTALEQQHPVFVCHERKY